MAKKKIKNDIMLVTYNHDRQAILNEESWVYTDSLNMAKTIDTENKEMNRKIRQVLNDYKLEDGDKTPPVTQEQEFIYNNTDFTYSICYYKDTKGELRPYYKLSKDLVTLVMFKFKTERAKEFQMLYIAQFNSMTKELDWYRSRYLGIVTRTNLTDAIKDCYKHDYNGFNIYVDFTDLVYTTIYGLRASQIRQMNSEKFERKNNRLIGNVRPWLKDDDIKLVDDLEKEICVLIKYDMTYDQIRSMLQKRYAVMYNLVLNDVKRESK